MVMVCVLSVIVWLLNVICPQRYENHNNHYRSLRNNHIIIAIISHTHIICWLYMKRCLINEVSMSLWWRVTKAIWVGVGLGKLCLVKWGTDNNECCESYYGTRAIMIRAGCWMNEWGWGKRNITKRGTNNEHSDTTTIRWGGRMKWKATRE
jgi:hypothetical protein